jgi:hypothetical protein
MILISGSGKIIIEQIIPSDALPAVGLHLKLHPLIGGLLDRAPIILIFLIHGVLLLHELLAQIRILGVRHIGSHGLATGIVAILKPSQRLQLLFKCAGIHVVTIC